MFVELGYLLLLERPWSVPAEMLHQSHDSDLGDGRDEFGAIELEIGLVKHEVCGATGLPNVCCEVCVPTVFGVNTGRIFYHWTS